MFDYRTIFITPLRQIAPWLAMVLIVTWAGYPGVVCVTPLAWLLATRVGLIVVRRSISESSARRIQEAALAGAWLGLLEGMLFIVIVPLLGEVKPSEQTNAIFLSTCMVGMGILAGAALSAFTAQQDERRRQQ